MTTENNQEPPNRLSILSGRRVRQAVWFLLIIGLCISNGLLIKQNRELKAIISQTDKPLDLLKSRQQVPPFTANTLSGQRQIINYADHTRTVLLVFAPQCTACESILPYWREIQEACERKQYPIYGISLDDSAKTAAFLKAKELRLETFADLDARTKEAYKLSITPLTIVIDHNGVVEKIWPGIFNQEAKTDVENYFGIAVAGDVK
jgi:peroxiredoxin